MFLTKKTKKEEAGNKLKEMCKKLLANTVIEDYRFEIDPDVE